MIFPIDPQLIRVLGERVADGTITFASAKVVLDELWDMGMEVLRTGGSLGLR